MKPYLPGAGEKGAVLQLMIDGQTDSTVTVGSDGRWQALVSLTAGATYAVEVSQLDEDGTTVVEQATYV